MNDFCIYILSYKRYDRVYTVQSLLDSNYTGDWYIVIGNDDPYIEQYIEKYNEKIIVISKEYAMSITDACDNFNKKMPLSMLEISRLNSLERWAINTF